MKKSKKQALVILAIIILLLTSACNSLSPVDDPSDKNEYSHMHTQYITSCNSDPISSSMDMSAENSAKASSSDENESKIYSEEPSEESSVPETDQDIEEILKVENGTDFTFEDGEARVLNFGPSAFFVDDDETIWIFDNARRNYRLLVYKNNSLIRTISLPEYKGGEALMYGDDNNIYIACEPNVTFKIDGTIWTINKETHAVSSDTYWKIPEGSMIDFYRMYPYTFLTINDNLYLTCIDRVKKYDDNTVNPDYAYYKIENGHATQVEQSTYYVDDKHSDSGLFEFRIPENICGSYDTPSDGQYAKMLRVTDNDYTVLSENNMSGALITIYRYDAAGKLLASAYTLRTVDMYCTNNQDYCVSRNGKIYRFETADGDSFSGMTVSRITLGTRTRSSEELYTIESDYFDDLRSKNAIDTSDNTSDDEKVSQVVTNENPNDYFPTSLKRSDVINNAEAMCNLSWTILPENLDLPSGNNNNPKVIPSYIWNAGVGATVKSIPYCWAGFNGLTVLGGINSFLQAQKNFKLTTGNISGSSVSGTCGLECSGFVCSAYQIDHKFQSWDLVNLGTQIDFKDIKPMDLIVSANVHCLLFSSYNPLNHTVEVYDCTKGFGVSNEIGKCSLRTIDRSRIGLDENLNSTTFQFRTPWNPVCNYTYTAVGSNHVVTCTDCGHTYTEPHNMHLQSVSNTHHQLICNICGAMDAYYEYHDFQYNYLSKLSHIKSCPKCGYTVTESHNLENNYRYDESMHYIYCTDCNRSIASAAHNIINHVCTACGYNDQLSSMDNDKLPIGNAVIYDKISDYLK